MLRLRPFKDTDAKIISDWDVDRPKKELYMRHGEDMACFFTAFHDQGIIGCVALFFTDESMREMILSDMVLHPMERGKGNGRKMLRLTMNYAFEILQVEGVFACLDGAKEKAYRCLCALGFREEKDDQQESGDRHHMILRSLADMEQSVLPAAYEETAVHEILDSNLFHYAFQPIVEAATGNIYGYEALMRAEYNGLVSPNVILEYATKENRLYDVERATFFNVMSVVYDNLSAFEGRKIFINSIPGNFLTDKDYKKLKKEYGSLLEHFVVEVTEETELKDYELQVLLQRSEKDGFGLAIDDYGTGYSNPSSLLRYLPNCVKIDRLLIANIQEEPKKQHFVKSMISFAHDNGLLALAEGVETGAELKTVVKMGIDLVQGFYTARPSFEILKEIDPRIRNEMISANVREQNQNDRKVFMVTDEKELPVMRLALEQYTAIHLPKGELTLVGNADYIAGMTIRTRDGSDCRVTLRDVYLESFQDMPCIDVGQNAHLTLVIEGENHLHKVGICVPEGSSLTIEGEGNLKMRVQGIQSYGIGNLWDSGVGSIRVQSIGLLDILVEADEGIGIGGGKYRRGDGISIESGTIRIATASIHAVGLGCVEGEMPILVSDAHVKIEMNSDASIGIGSLMGRRTTTIRDSFVQVEGSGSFVTGVGGRNAEGGRLVFEKCRICVKANGQAVELVGTSGGETLIELIRAELQLKGEGSDVLGLGTREENAEVHMTNSNCDINIHAAKYHLLAVDESKLQKIESSVTMKANED